MVIIQQQIVFQRSSTAKWDGGKGKKKGENGDIYVMDKEGNNPRQLTENGGGNNHPIWTPSGKEIIFSSERTGNHEIHVMNINGKDLRNLTNHPTPDYQPFYFVPSLLSIQPVENLKLTNWTEIK